MVGERGYPILDRDFAVGTVNSYKTACEFVNFESRLTNNPSIC